jgi:hypothetical protein
VDALSALCRVGGAGGVKCDVVTAPTLPRHIVTRPVYPGEHGIWSSQVL